MLKINGTIDDMCAYSHVMNERINEIVTDNSRE